MTTAPSDPASDGNSRRGCGLRVFALAARPGPPPTVIVVMAPGGEPLSE